MSRVNLTEDDEGLLGRVRLDLRFWVPVLVDAIAHVHDAGDGREIPEPPSPPQGPETLLLGRRGSSLAGITAPELAGNERLCAAEGGSCANGAARCLEEQPGRGGGLSQQHGALGHRELAQSSCRGRHGSIGERWRSGRAGEGLEREGEVVRNKRRCLSRGKRWSAEKSGGFCVGYAAQI